MEATKPHATRKRLECGKAFGIEADPQIAKLTLKIEHGIRSYLHGEIDHDVLDDLVQKSWVRLLGLPEEKRTTAKAFTVGKRMAGKHWERTVTERSRTVDTWVETEDGLVDTLDNLADNREPTPITEGSGAIPDYLESTGRKALGDEEYRWLLAFVQKKGFRTDADCARAKILIEAMRLALQTSKTRVVTACFRGGVIL